MDFQSFMATVKERNPHQTEFQQAVCEVSDSLTSFINEHPKYEAAKILERMIEPERLIRFRVTWVDDQGDIQINRGYRIQMNSAIGPYKGGLRFHPSVNESILKFLAFEQVFKNSLTGLPMGGGKGGSDFNPKGKSDNEVMRFCQAFMSELFRHIGPDTDVPAGDIGVGGREIGYLYGMYRKLRNENTGTLTGKGLEWGGSRIRPEATGYGATYFAAEMLKTRDDSFEGKRIAISGAGNVAQYASEKVMQLGGKVVSLSDSNGTIVFPDGMTQEQHAAMMELKNVKRGRIRELQEQFEGLEYLEGQRPWSIKCDIAMPCATQNELNLAEAKQLVDNGCVAVVEGANMPTEQDAVSYLLEQKVLFAPGKAANAGGVAVSGLEMSQNSVRIQWTREEVDERLQDIMKSIHTSCVEHGQQEDYINYVKGANIAGFKKVAEAMLAQGVL